MTQKHSAELQEAAENGVAQKRDMTNSFMNTGLRARAHRALFSWLVSDIRPFHVVQSKAFRAFCEVFKYTPPSRPLLNKMLYIAHSEFEDALALELNSQVSVAITCDTWSSDSLDGYLGITAHFITEDFAIQRRMKSI